MLECYTVAAPGVWPGSFMSACSGAVLPLSFTRAIRSLEGLSVAANAKGLSRVSACVVSLRCVGVCQGMVVATKALSVVM